MNSINLAPVVTGRNRSGVVVDCPEHSLPFGVIFEEYRSRRGDELEQCVGDILKTDKANAWNALERLLKERNDKYHSLEKCKANPNSLPSIIDELEKECHDLEKPLKRLLHKMNGSAVCLSGGGIRSASFCLGILEGLARFSLGILHSAQKDDGNDGLLQNLDYLSTVSGGGYIGSWLTAWVYRRRTAVIQRAQSEVDAAMAILNQSQAEINGTMGIDRSLISRTTSLLRSWTHTAKPESSEQEAALRQRLDKIEATAAAASEQLKDAKASTWRSSYLQVIKALAGVGDFTSGDPAPQAVRHLREYTSYLAPAMGLSLDSWDLAAIVFRNLFVNWLMLGPLLVAIVALPQLSYQVTRNLNFTWNPCWSLLTIGVVLFLFIVAATFCGYNLPSHRNAMSTGPATGRVVLGFAGPVLLANWIVAQVWEGNQWVTLTYWGQPQFAIFFISYAGFGTLAGLLFLSYRRRILASSSGVPPSLRPCLMMQAGALLSAGLATALLGLLTICVFPWLIEIHPAKFGFIPNDRLFTILALPLITLVPLVSASLFAGLLGVFEQEEDREWLSRAGGLQLAVIAAWILAHAVALYATDMLAAVYLALSGALLGGAGSALGWSGATSAGPRPVKTAQLGKLGSFLSKHDLLLPTVCAAALLLLTLGVAGTEYTLAGAEQATLGRHLVILIASVVLACLLNWAININLFSLHGMYRLRLMRAFLGASNAQRYPDSFTQFDQRDTPLEIELPGATGSPLHVINTTLNLVGTKNLAWRQRRAESFTFSPLHSGAWRLGYVPTRVYAGTDGVSVATAMAISGAAFNPNMGYHSSPLVTLLMTFFNVRLGWWLPNPARESGALWPWVAKGLDFLHKTGPTVALEPLILEALGMTDDTYRWIELTDGAHFENLSLYEMVLRRCHHIVVVDAGADPKCQFEDLGNALRKIEIDLGIPIRFKKGINMRAGAKPDNRYCSVAMIDYGCVDADVSMTQSERDNLAGTLIYIKAGITGKEPPDIKQYALTHDDFPHETTANQFFNESQFESYRHLGSYQLETIVTEGLMKRSEWMRGRESDEPEHLVERTIGTDFETLAAVAGYYTDVSAQGNVKIIFGVST
jgi:hypothetical protein